jgi:hypothetical protein
MNPLEYWNPENFEISSFKFKLNERKGKSYTTSGSDNSGLCTYTYNELGFRGESISKEGFRIMSLGCSNTEGVGVNDDQTWPYQFSKLIPNGVDFNFGTGGRSNDFISRCLISYYDIIKPDLVLVMYTSPTRREIYTKDGGIEPFVPSVSWGFMEETQNGREIQEHLTHLQNDTEDHINWYKNHMLIKLFLESKKCNWLWNGGFASIEYSDKNRFNGDYFPFKDLSVDGFHPGPRHNKDYAQCLYNHISEYFPEYLTQLK